MYNYASESGLLERMEILEPVRAEWESCVVGATSGWSDDDIPSLDTQAHWHWDVVTCRTLVELANAKLRQKIFISMREDYDTLMFGSPEWINAAAQALNLELPLFSLNTSHPFWVTLGAMPPDAYEKYADEEIPVFNAMANSRLRAQRGSRDKWMKFAKNYYQAYMDRVFDIYLVVDPDAPDAPRYRMSRSLAISPDQRIFLAGEVGTGKLRVVKWSATISLAHQSWMKVRNAGTKMIQFETNCSVARQQPVMLMEPLSRIDASDNIYALLLDVLPQLESIHRAGMVHSDVKVDNIMKRVGEQTEYFLIDYDSVSYHSIEGIDHAVARRVFSILWASQIRANGTIPTSYRYDLEELFYAVADLAKQQRRRALGDKAKLDAYSDAETLMKAKYSYKDILPFTHQTKIINDTYLSQMYRIIMNLPERLPFSQINHESLREFVRKGPAQNPALGLTSELIPALNVKNAKTMIPRPTANVCSEIYTALTECEPERDLDERRRAIDQRVNFLHTCMRCGAYSQTACQKCSIPYCSLGCQHADWATHKARCRAEH